MITNSLFVQYVSFSLCFSFSKTATAACLLSTSAGCFSIHTKKGAKNMAEYQTKSTIHFVKSYEKTACEYGLFFPHV